MCLYCMGFLMFQTSPGTPDGLFVAIIRQLQSEHRLPEALEVANQGIANAGATPMLLAERAGMLRLLGRTQASLADYRALLRQCPEDAMCQYNASLALLADQQYAEGWTLYEQRWQSTQRAMRREFPVPQWDGTFDIGDRVILIHAEQGFGDTFQFCRYLQELAALGARPVVAVPASQKTLIARMDCAPRVVSPGENFPAVTCHCPLMSLPHALGRLTGTPVGEEARSAYLRADPAAVADWQARLAALPGLKIGICWHGDTQQPFHYCRSTTLENFLPLLGAGTLVSLINTPTPAEVTQLRTQGIHDYAAQLKSFEDTAALICNMDAVVTTDTAVAHLAGALGRPCHLLLCEINDWRWQVGGGRPCLWYASMQIHRKRPGQDWPDLIRRSVLPALAGVQPVPAAAAS